MIPLYHDFEDETVLVVGGGPVGARKARRFAREADVVVVSAEFPAEEYGDVECIRAIVAPGGAAAWLDRVDPVLVVAATDDGAVNEAIERAARQRGVLVNRADRAGSREPGSVVVPATVRDGDVVVSISTGGASPALSAALRERIEAEIDGAGRLAELTGQLRAELKARDVPPAARREAIRSAVRSETVWKALGAGRTKERRTLDAAVEAALEEHT